MSRASSARLDKLKHVPRGVSFSLPSRATARPWRVPLMIKSPLAVSAPRPGGFPLRLILSLSLLCVACPAATLPLAFESRGAQYLARGAGYSVTIDAGGAQFAWGRQSFAMQVLGADSHAHLEGLGRMPGHVTYMLGTTRGATYSLYSQVLCRGI